MEQVPGRPKGGSRRSKEEGSTSFFVVKVKALLLRTRKAMESFPGGSDDRSFEALARLHEHDVGAMRTLEDVVEGLGGKTALAAKVFISVTDDDEKHQLHQLEALGATRVEQAMTEDAAVMDQLTALVAQVQTLARCLLVAGGTPLVKGILALPVVALNEKVGGKEDEDQGEDENEGEEGEDEKEASRDDAKEAPQQKKKKKKEEKKRARSKVTHVPKDEAVAREKSSEAKKGKKKKIEEEKASRKKKQEKAGGAKAVREPEHRPPAVVIMEGAEEEEQLSKGIGQKEVAELAKEAAAEYDEICKLSSSSLLEPQQYAQRVEAPPDPEQVVASVVTLKDVAEYLCEMQSVPLNSLEGIVALQSWWRLVRRACQIRGLFELIRTQNQMGKKIQERYAKVAATVHGSGRHVLKFAQASRYERLGKFLLDFPLFVYQRKWTTLTDWFQKVDFNSDKDVVLLDCICSIVPLSSVFLRDGFLLHTHGFKVHSGLMMPQEEEYMPDEFVELCKKHCEENGEVVFNNHKDAGSRHNDKKRLQLNFDDLSGEQAGQFKERLLQTLTDLYPWHKKVDSMVVLLSKSGCAAQLAHTNYSPQTLARVLDGGNEAIQIPLACLVALNDETGFDVWPGAIRFDASRKVKPMRITLCAGDALVFRGDLVHAGAALDGEEDEGEGGGRGGGNVRIHVYLDVDDIIRSKHAAGNVQIDETYFMCDASHIVPRVV